MSTALAARTNVPGRHLEIQPAPNPRLKFGMLTLVLVQIAKGFDGCEEQGVGLEAEQVDAAAAMRAARMAAMTTTDALAAYSATRLLASTVPIRWCGP